MDRYAPVWFIIFFASTLTHVQNKTASDGSRLPNCILQGLQFSDPDIPVAHGVAAIHAMVL